MIDIVVDCDVCEGSGEVSTLHRLITSIDEVSRPVDGGKWVTEIQECEECGGSGTVPLSVQTIEER